MTTKHRILLADDHATVREGLRLLVDSQPDMEVVATAANGAEVLEQVPRFLPDIVVMDVSMPSMGGLTATAQLKKDYPAVKVLPLTRLSDSSSVTQAMLAGASGYVLKQSRPAELLKAIRAVAGGEEHLDSSLRGPLAPPAKTPAPRSASGAPLSPREIEVFRHIAWGATNKEIAAQLGLSVKTVEAHKANGMRKLGMSGRLDIVRYAMQQGWLAESNEP
jgi:DNA-binding NarL/FixJ family response regulator